MRFAHFSLRYRDILVAALIMLFAFGLRVVVLADRAAGDAAFDPLPHGTDQSAYVGFAEGYEAGTWPDAPFRYQPGFPYFLILARQLVGSSLMMMRLALGLTNAFACGLMVGIGWLLTGRRWGGYFAGLLLAVYPVAIFYSTELLVEGLALVYVTLFLFLVLWQRQRLSLGRSLLIGLVLGLTTITRTNLGLLWGAYALWLLLECRLSRRFAAHAALSALALAAAIAPVTLYNMQAGDGEFQLITNVGVEEIYRGNSRDSDGTYVQNAVSRTTVDNGYTAALLTDIRLYPQRFVELQGRKFGIYWSDSEPPNNIDYVLNGEAVSPLLRAIPLDFRLLALAGLLGTVALYWRDRRLGLFFALVHAAIFAGVMVMWVVSRLRVPAIPPLVAASALLAVWLVESLRAPERGRRLLKLAPALLVVVLGLAFAAWAIDNLPRKVRYDALPADAHPANVVFDDTLRLVGWRTLPDWPAGAEGWAEPDQAYAVELFWDVLQPAAADYEMYLAYVVDGVRVAGRDTPIGKVSAPIRGTADWQPGAIYAEIVGFKLPFDTPLAAPGAIRLGVYTSSGDVGDENRPVVNVPVSAPSPDDDVVVQPFAVFDPARWPETASGLQSTDVVFGGQIALRGVGLPALVAPGAPLTLTLAWEATADATQDATLFVHVMDAADQLAASYDGPAGGLLGSSTWPVGYPVTDTITLDAPTAPGLYRVYAGLYDPLTRERLPADAPDFRPLLGEIEVTAPPAAS